MLLLQFLRNMKNKNEAVPCGSWRSSYHLGAPANPGQRISPIDPLTSPQIKQISVKMNWYLLLNQQILEGEMQYLKKEEIYMCIFSWHSFKSCLQLIYNAHSIQVFIWNSNKSFEWVGACVKVKGMKCLRWIVRLYWLLYGRPRSLFRDTFLSMECGWVDLGNKNKYAAGRITA